MSTNSNSTATVAKREFSFWLWALGTVVGTLSLISLVQKLAQVGLAPLPKMIIDYYSAVFAPLRRFLVWISPIHLPDWYVDAYLLSFILIGIAWRVAFGSIDGIPVWIRVFTSIKVIKYSALLSIFLLGFLLLFVVLVGACIEANRDGKSWATMLLRDANNFSRPYLSSLGMVIAAAVVFFAWNYTAQ